MQLIIVFSGMLVVLWFNVYANSPVCRLRYFDSFKFCFESIESLFWFVFVLLLTVLEVYIITSYFYIFVYVCAKTERSLLKCDCATFMRDCCSNNNLALIYLRFYLRLFFNCKQFTVIEFFEDVSDCIWWGRDMSVTKITLWLYYM